MFYIIDTCTTMFCTSVYSKECRKPTYGKVASSERLVTLIFRKHSDIIFSLQAN